MHKEQWVKSIDFPNYEVSDTGKIRRLKNQKELKLTTNSSSYVIARIYYNKKKYTKTISKLVWEAFNGYKCTQTIDHIDRDKSNNMLDNLRCITNKENCLNRKKKNNNYQLTNDIKKEIINKIKNDNVSTVKIWKEYGVPTNYMSVILKRGSWNKFLDDKQGI
jgi:hypothetical protein